MGLFSRLFGGGADRETGRRIRDYRREVEVATAAQDRGALERVLARREELALSEDDVAIELEMIEGHLQALDLGEAIARGERPPVVETGHRVLGTDTCYFTAPASALTRGADQTGRLFLTSRRLVFMGGSVKSVSWGTVAELREDGRDIIVLSPAGELAHRFRCNSYIDSKRGIFLARWLRTEARNGLGRGQPRPESPGPGRASL
jgi:hypothetical protein